MTDHLPDCDDYAFSGAGFHPKCERICICRQVRRIEHRVFQEQIKGRQHDMVMAYLRALDAAREAVAVLPKGGMGQKAHELWRDALAAIDALRAAE